MRPNVPLLLVSVGFFGACTGGRDEQPADVVDPSSGASAETPSTRLAALRPQALAATVGTALDLDGDGRAEWTLVKDGPAGREEVVDSDGDGAADMRWWSEPKRYGAVWMRPDGTQRFRREVRAEPDGLHIRHEWDGNWTEATATSGTAAVALVGMVRGQSIATTVPAAQPKQPSLVIADGNDPGTCSPVRTEALRAAMREAIDTGIDCLHGIDGQVANEFRRITLEGTVFIDCIPFLGEPPGYKDCANTMVIEGYGCQLETPDGQPCFSVHVSNKGFDPKRCGPLAATIAHELLHYVFGAHESEDPEDDPFDRIAGCEQFCFKAPTPENCGRCLGTATPGPRDKRCQKRRQPNQNACWECGCNQSTTYPHEPRDSKYWPSREECILNCSHQELGCLGAAQCEDPAPCP